MMRHVETTPLALAILILSFSPPQATAQGLKVWISPAMLVTESDLVATATLGDVSEAIVKNGTTRFGTLSVERAIWPLEAADSLKLRWLLASDGFSHLSHRRALWLLRFAKDGSVRADYAVPLDDAEQISRVLAELRKAPVSPQADIGIPIVIEVLDGELSKLGASVEAGRPRVRVGRSRPN